MLVASLENGFLSLCLPCRRVQIHLQPPRTRQQGYVFAMENPFLDDPDSFAKVHSALTRSLSLLRLAAARKMD